MTIRDIGRLAVRLIPWIESPGRAVYRWLPASMHDTPTKHIVRFFADDAVVFFAQIGAYDGVAGDPLRPIILERPNFRGILVEPQTEAFEALQRNYAAQADRLTFVNAAVDADGGERVLYRVAEGDPRNAGLPSWAFETTSFDEAHVRKHFATAHIEAIPIRAAKFADIAEGLPGARVDLIVIDVEGAERPIIESIDVDRHGVRFLMYEHKHLPQDDIEHLTDHLERAGFTLKVFGRDTIAWRRL